MRIRPDSLAFTLLLGALATLPPLSIDMGLPALALIQASLAASAGQATLTLSVFLVGYGAAQLLVGPVSDRVGRRPVMLGGLVLFALGGVGCALAPSIGLLLACRLVAGIGAAGSTTLVMAIVRDVFTGQAARVQISTVSMVMSVAPMIAPSIGGLMLLLGGWRFIYSLLAIAGIVLLAAVWCGLTETRPPDRGARLDLVGRYAAVLRQRRTVGYAAINALGFGSLFAFIAVSSVVLIGRMGASVALFGLLFALTSGGILAGNWCNTLLARRDVRQELPLAVGLWLAPLAAIAASLFLAAGVERLLTFVPFIVLIGFCRGITSPNATHAALEPVPNHAGVASAMMGCGQMLVGALSGGLVAALFPLLGPLAVTLAMAGFNIAALVVWRAVERGR
jgi:DHA1 family bicyclomycin/chloramphenicol resistance-like MFS transporter